MRSKLTYRWVVLALSWIIYFSFGLISGALAPLVTPIMNDLDITYTQMGILSGSWQLVYVFLAQPLGLLVDRLGSYRSLLSGIVIISISSILRRFAISFGSLFLFISILGVGGIMISTGLPKLISVWFSGKERGTATGIYTTGFTSGGMAAIGTTNSIVLPTVGSWENVFLLYGFFGFIIAVLWLFFGRTSTPHYNVKVIKKIDTWDTIKRIFKKKNVWLIIIVGITSYLIDHSLSSWLPKILELKGMTAADAGFTALFFTFSGIIGSIIIPRLSYFAGSMRLVLSILLLIFGITCPIIGIAEGGLILIGIILTGASVKALKPILQITLMDVPEVGSEHMGSVGGMYFAFGLIGGFSGPLLFGYFMDLTGYFLSGIIFLSVFSLTMILVAASLRT